MINRAAQNIIHLIILIIIAGICYWLSPKATPSVHGIFLPSGTISSPISPAQVSFFKDNYPTSYTTLGEIRTAIHLDSADQTVMQNDANASLQYAAKLAAEHGANGVVLTALAPTQELGPLGSIVLYATAIKY
jgi:hypothetical protein